MFKKRNEKRSPLKARPLRVPGQSVDEEIRRVVDEEIIVWLVVAIFAAILAGLEWSRWLLGSPPQPILISLMALAFIGYVATKVRKGLRTVKNMRLGRDGERAVGQYLDELREKGYRVLHDIVGNGFNVDHVVFSPHGIFAIETKTLSKPNDRGATVRIDDGGIKVNGFSLDRDPISQAKAQATWLHDTLAESTGKSFAIKSVILFPGWYVEPMRNTQDRRVWVLNPKALPAFIANEPQVLSDEDMRLAAYHLCRYIRTMP